MRHRSDHQILVDIEEKVEALMATVEEVQAAVATLQTDLEGLAATALAEFEKLEKELTEAGTAVELAPLKASIEALDTKAKEASSKIPTN